jgi:hypothetical protein
MYLEKGQSRVDDQVPADMAVVGGLS